MALALADKIDTLVGFFAINETPTGSKDPFALRRAALGVIRLILENKLRLPLTRLFQAARPSTADPSRALLAFFADRLKVHMKEAGMRHDLIAAVFALGEDDLARLVTRTEALQGFPQERGRRQSADRLSPRRQHPPDRGEEGQHGLYRRAAARSAASAGRARRSTRRSTPPPSKARPPSRPRISPGSMAALARLRGPVDRFFDKVTVNTDDKELRENRLRLLSQIRDTLNLVADFSLVEG